MDNTSCCDLNNEEELREVMVKISLERVDTRKSNSGDVIGQWDNEISNEFRVCKEAEVQTEENEKTYIYKKCGWFFNREGPIEYTVEVNIYYQGHRERTEIDVIEE